ncbi:MAG: hypothetical protein HY674_15755 [Chloroflexi bacterium]|nr:hypothetical protein [Chloroflexota bacterium]
MKQILSCLGLSLLTCGAAAQVFLTDSFSYANGPLVGAAGSSWTAHSSGSVLLSVNEGRAFIDQANTAGSKEDISALLQSAGSPVTFGPDGNANDSDNFLYSAFTVNFSAPPNNTVGSYFAHLKDSSTGFGGRVWASTLNAAEGAFRIGIANSSTGGAGSGQIANDLSLGITYEIVTRYNVDTAFNTIWLNPTDENSPGVTAADSVTVRTIAAFALRQGTTSATPTAGAPGSLFLDDLRVGRTFADVTVVPEPHHLALAAALGLLVFSAYRRLSFR